MSEHSAPTNAPGEPGERGHRDPRAAARTWQLLQAQTQAPWLHQEVARRMSERLGLLARLPELALDWSGRAGGDLAVLKKALPRATVHAADARAAAASGRWWSRLGGKPQPDFDTLARGGQAQLVWSNMQLHWAVAPVPLLQTWRDALTGDGMLFFSTLGPGTALPLQALFAARGWPPPFAPFDDMHDLGDAMVQAGFADPVMDQETLTLTWPDAPALLAELRTLGRNVHGARFAGLRGRRWQAALHQALESLRQADGRLHLPFEIVYGHATRGELRARMEDTTQVSLAQMRRMIRGG